jgi:hypothetical protein
MRISFEYLDEPRLEFGHHFEHQDARTGLAEFGPFGKSVPGLHPEVIKLGFIGTRETISEAKAWVEECSAPIDSAVVRGLARQPLEPIGTMFGEHQAAAQASTRLVKILNPDFVGFNKATPFECSFQLNERWEQPVDPRTLSRILQIPGKEQRILELVDLFAGLMEALASNSPTPDIVIIALTQAIEDEAYNAKVDGQYYLDLRRVLKARVMQWNIPVQIMRYSTLVGKGRELQDKATRAWNFCTAEYYKAQGVPWRLVDINPQTCFVGVSFYTVMQDNGIIMLNSSVAQAFDYLGQGLVLRGDPFAWSKDRYGPSPHLTKISARKLISDTLKAYMKVQGVPPRRVVVHKTSDFWGPEHHEHNELDGFYEGIDEVFPGLEIDLVGLRKARVALFREGNYPPLRGTHFSIEDHHHFLYTMGYIPYLQTYPGPYVPRPLEITDHHGGTAPRDLMREFLALTKMNVNNCTFATAVPITIAFSKQIGEIMKHIPAETLPHPHYRFYM